MRVVIKAAKESGVAHVNPNSIFVKLLRKLGFLSPAVVYSVEEERPGKELDRQIAALMEQNMEPRLICMAPRDYHELCDYYRSHLVYPVIAGDYPHDLRMKTVYAKSWRLDVYSMLPRANDAVKRLLERNGWAEKIEVYRGKDDRINFKLLAYKTIDVVLCPWLDSSVVLPYLFIEDKKVGEFT